MGDWRPDAMLRVVAGSRGSRLIETPPGRSTRPTSDRVREALFSMLGDLTHSRVLALFAGSGALGIEALSRGAAGAVFVENSAKAASCVRRNLESLELAAEGEVVHADWLKAVRGFAGGGQRFDIVFVDPPYADAASISSLLGDELSLCLDERATVVFESGVDSPLVAGLRLEREKRYGDTVVRLYGTN
ncbi:MAG: 16S rRNA (guanine(966)-N(2))-methyltransferase RsmD [Actinomycetes bacterium]